MEKKPIYILDLSKLVPGDIILGRYPDRLSKNVRERTNSDYSHAMLYMGYGSIIHSNLDGVASINAQREGVENIDDMVVLRAKELERLSIWRLVMFARRTIGTSYSLREAMQVTGENAEMAIDGTKSNRQFCTKFVAMAYSAAGVEIVQNPSLCSPRDILTSDKLTRVQDAMRLATPLERELIEETSVILEEQEKVTKELLCEVRQKTGCDVQTLEQLFELSLKEAKYDEIIAGICENHPYFHLIDKYHELHPEEYDYAKFIDKYGKNSRDAAEFLIENMRDVDWLYNKQYELLQEEYERSHGKTCRIFLDLYRTLVEDCADRMTLFTIASW